MAVKKQNPETVEQNAAVQESTGMKDPDAAQTVPIRLFSDNGRYKGDLFVSVNGVNYQIRRGVTVDVPPEVAEVIRHSEEQDTQSAARLEIIMARSE